ncbi:MAG: 16S rRNA (cytidine(1402)-2'-O)-methyltransferase [Rhodospirillaceae bacterium]
MVSTPIGNLMDITFRAIDVLGQADVIACEDTRVTGKLLKHYGISTRMIVYNDHSGPKTRPLLLADLKAGKRVALVSDAGTPLISDPGYKLVSECAENGIRIIPIPGASAMLAGLVTSGLPTDKVLYAGFLPSKQKARQSSIKALAGINATLVFYETGPRLAATLADLAEHLGSRAATVARELTKLFEEITRDNLPILAKSYNAKPDVKGEVIILVGPPLASVIFDTEDTEAAILNALETMSVRDAAAAVADLTGQPRRVIYAHALQLKNKSSKKM